MLKYSTRPQGAATQSTVVPTHTRNPLGRPADRTPPTPTLTESQQTAPESAQDAPQAAPEQPETP